MNGATTSTTPDENVTRARSELSQCDERLQAALSSGDLTRVVTTGLQRELARAAVVEAEATAAKIAATRADWKRSFLTVLLAAVFVAILGLAFSLRMPNTSIIASVNTTSVLLRLDGSWDAKNLFDAKGVQVTEVSVLSTTATPAATYPDGATVEIEGPIRITQLLIPGSRQLSISKADSSLVLRAQYPRGWVSQTGSKDQRLGSLIISVGKEPAALKVTSDVENKPTQLKPGERLVVAIGGTKEDGATLTLLGPSPWDAFLPTNKLDFIDDNLLTSVVGGTLKIPSVDKSIDLRRRDRITIDSTTNIADCLEPNRPLAHCALVSYDDEGVLSVSLKYLGSRVSLGAGGVDVNVVPTVFDWTLKNAPIVTTIASLFGLFLGLALWPLASRLTTAKQS